MLIEDVEVGRKVIYKPYRPCDEEEGVITNFNDSYVFVRYGSDSNSKATKPDRLHYI